MSFCNKCGVENEQGAQFCRRCGGAMRPEEPEKKGSGKKKAILITIISLLVVAMGAGGFIFRDDISGFFTASSQKTESREKEEEEDEEEDEKNHKNKDRDEDEDEDEKTGKKPEEKIAKRTFLLYIIGSNLEYETGENGRGHTKGLASMDIAEILKAGTTDDVNIVIQTGGTVKWKNSTAFFPMGSTWASFPSSCSWAALSTLLL